MVGMGALVTCTTDINTDHRCGSTVVPEVALGSSLGLDVIMVLDGSTGHTDQPDFSSTMTLGHQHGLRCWPRYWASAQPLVVTVTTDVNADPGYNRATGPDMAFINTLGPDVSMDLSCNPGNSYQHG